MTDSISTDWIGDMILEAEIDGHAVRMDSEEQHGGQNAGPSPKTLILASLSGCTGMDVVSILNKKRIVFDVFRIHVTGDTADDYPKVYTRIHVIYEFTGKSFANNREVLTNIKRAVDLSIDKYCATAAMLKKICELTYEIRLADS